MSVQAMSGCVLLYEISRTSRVPYNFPALIKGVPAG
jgi:hypothetical protein